MRIKTTVEIDHQDFRSAPVKHELWRELSHAEVREIAYPERPPFELMAAWQAQVAMRDYERQIERHQKHVQMISLEIATALGRALGNKGPDR